MGLFLSWRRSLPSCCVKRQQMGLSFFQLVALQYATKASWFVVVWYQSQNTSFWKTVMCFRLFFLLRTATHQHDQNLVTTSFGALFLAISHKYGTCTFLPCVLVIQATFSWCVRRVFCFWNNKVQRLVLLWVSFDLVESFLVRTCNE